MQKVNGFLLQIDSYLGSHPWFIVMLLGTGLFFTLYLRFPQIRYFKHAVRVVKGKYDRKSDVGDTSHFQALATALSGTVGTGNIAGVALAIHLGGPAALFWMLVTAMIGMTTKFVEVTLSHKYREKTSDGSISGGPMYYMKKRLNIKLNNGKVIKTGTIMGIFFAGATILSSFGTGSLPQINSISNAMFATFGLNKVVTGAVLAVLLGFVIIGGIKRIAKVTEKLVPGMAIIYFLGAFAVLITNYENIIPSIVSIFSNVVSGSAATGGFLGASFAFVLKKGVGRGLFSNEAGQGSAPIAHAAARAHEPVSEGLVAILEPFIDTIIICTLTGLVLLSSGVWNEKLDNHFQYVDLEILAQEFSETDETDVKALYKHLNNKEQLATFNGSLEVIDGQIQDKVTILHARSIAEEISVLKDDQPFTGQVDVVNGRVREELSEMSFVGKSLIHSAPLTTEAFKRGLFGHWGQYIVSIGLLLFAFSTAISWSYYGAMATTFLFGEKSVMIYRIIYVIAFFVASFTDTTIVWSISLITIVLMTLPNLIGLVSLRKEIKTTIKQYWIDFKAEHPDENIKLT